MHRLSFISRSLTSFAICLAASSGQAQVTFTTIGDLPGGLHRSEALALSGDGTTIVGSSTSASGRQVFRWTIEDGMVAMPSHDDGYQLLDSNAGISFDGSTIVASTQSGLAMRWNQSTGYEVIPGLPGSTVSFGVGISDDGQAAVGGALGFPGEAFHWSAQDGTRGLGSLRDPPEQSASLGISGDGRVAVGWSYATPGIEAFRWTEGEGLVGLGDLSGGQRRSYALAASYDGSVIVGQSHESTGFRAFIWDQDTGMVPIGDPGLESIATDVSADGSVVVGTADQFGAFIWTQADGMRSLESLLVNDFGIDLEGWSLDRGIAISADGLTIIGDARKATGEREVFLATIPSPSSMLVLASAFIMQGRRNRHSFTTSYC